MECNNYGLCSAFAAVTFHLSCDFLTGVLVHLDAKIYQQDETYASEHRLNGAGHGECVIAAVCQDRYKEYAQEVLG